MFTLPVALIVAPTVILATFWSQKYLKGEASSLRGLFALGSFGFAGILLRMANLTVLSPFYWWNGARLAPLMAFVKGIPLYGDPNNGVLSAWIYGPVPVLAYLPTSLLRQPTSCILAGVILSELMVLIPAIVIVMHTIRNAGASGRLIGPIVLGALLCVVTETKSLVEGVFFVIADAPTLGLILIVCLLLMRARSRRSIAASATLTVLACWSKQTVAPFALVPALFLLLVDGAPAMAAYLSWLLIAGVILSTGFIWEFGARAMWFNMVTIPSRHPLQSADRGILFSLGKGFFVWLRGAIPGPAIPLALAAFMAVARKGLPSRKAFDIEHFRDLCWRRPWTVLILTSVILLPSGLLGYIKIWGDLNNFAPTHFCLLLGGCAGVIDYWPELASISRATTNFIAGAGCLVVLVTGIIADTVMHGGLDGTATLLAAPATNPQEEIFNFELANPGVAYFPWDPLPPLLVEKKLYHFEWGFVDRIDARLPPSHAQVIAHLPANMAFVAIQDLNTTYALQFLPTFTKVGHLDRLPDFTVYSSAQTSAPRSKVSTGQ